MGRYRLSAKAEADIGHILAWSQQQFGESARRRYQELLAAAFRDVAEDGQLAVALRPELGAAGLRVWHLRQSRAHVPSAVGTVNRPRHLVVYRRVGAVIEIVRVLHDSMELSRHLQGEVADSSDASRSDG